MRHNTDTTTTGNNNAAPLPDPALSSSPPPPPASCRHKSFQDITNGIIPPVFFNWLCVAEAAVMYLIIMILAQDNMQVRAGGRNG